MGPGSRNGGPHCVSRGSALGRLYFGRGTQLSVWPGEWVVLTSGKLTIKKEKIENGDE